MGFALGCWPKGNTDAKGKRQKKVLAILNVLTEIGKEERVYMNICVRLADIELPL